jgi:hypothetical protein
MSLVRNAQALSSLSAGAQQLVANIIAESNASNVPSGGGLGDKQKYFNHSYDKDPSTNGGKLSSGVKCAVYYMPSSTWEYNNWEVIDGATGMLSGRRRLVVREEGDKLSFYTTSHPKNEKPGMRTNVYVVFVPIDTSR